MLKHPFPNFLSVLFVCMFVCPQTKISPILVSYRLIHPKLSILACSGGRWFMPLVFHLACFLKLIRSGIFTQKLLIVPSPNHKQFCLDIIFSIQQAVYKTRFYAYVFLYLGKSAYFHKNLRFGVSGSKSLINSIRIKLRIKVCLVTTNLLTQIVFRFFLIL